MQQWKFVEKKMIYVWWKIYTTKEIPHHNSAALIASKMLEPIPIVTQEMAAMVTSMSHLSTPESQEWMSCFYSVAPHCVA
jgi:hypothetical protein